MADIRINSLPTTASASSSDDFLALDGATNGTRKLNAYSPTFGGNVTASGNLTVSGVTTSAGISNSGALTFTAAIGQVAGSIAKNATYGLTYYGVTGSSNDNTILNASGAVVLSNPAGTTNATLAGNLTVSGTVSASGDLKLGVAQTSQFSANRFSIINSATNNQKVSYELMVNDGTDNNRLAMFVDDNAHTLGFDTGTSNGNYNGLSFSIEGSQKLLIDRSGNLLIGTTTDRGRLTINKTASDTLSTANAAAFIGQPDNLEAGLLMQQTATTPYSFVLQGRSPSGTYQFPISLNPQGGNVLIGTTTDSANGKLQLATHTTSAGGIGYGTDTSLYRYGAGRLAIEHVGGIDALLFWSNSGTLRALGEADGSTNTFRIGSLSAGWSTAIVSGNNTTALTLDSSQRAIFSPARAASNLAVKIISSGAATNADRNFLLFGHNTAANAAVISQIDNTTTGAMSLILASGTDSTGAAAALTLDSSQNATFAGQITASGISHKLGSGGTGSANALLTIDGSSASNYGSYIVLQRNSTNKWQFGTYSGINGGTSDDFLLYNPTAANEALKIAAATSNATFAGSIAIGNTVNTVSPTSPNRTITMVIGGTTYYIHAKTTND